jgi:hypothetical protein
VRQIPTAIAVLSVLALAGCGGGGDRAPAAPSSTAVQSTLRGCSYLSQTDVDRASGETVHRLDLSPASEVICSTAFVEAAGDLVASISELRGRLAGLQQLRKAKIEQFGRKAIVPQPALGPGAFVARKRYLAFRRGERVVVLETGYGGDGKLLLTVSKLMQLARLVQGRL